MNETTPAASIIRLKDKYEIVLPLFEGPLDLLLHLIRQQEIDIYDIPVALITDQYLSYIQAMQNLNINVVGEFLEMAATLIYIKSKMLLPPDPSGDDELMVEDDPRRELVERLLEHEKFKNVAQEFYTRFQVESNQWHVSRENEVLGEDDQLVAASMFDIVLAFQRLLAREEEHRSVELDREEVSMADTMVYIRDIMQSRRQITFSKLLGNRVTRMRIVVLFLTLLELSRLRAVRLKQHERFTDILVERRIKADKWNELS